MAVGICCASHAWDPKHRVAAVVAEKSSDALRAAVMLRVVGLDHALVAGVEVGVELLVGELSYHHHGPEGTAELASAETPAGTAVHEAMRAIHPWAGH